MTTDALHQKRNTRNKRLLITAASIITFVLFLTNPGQAAHLTAIRETLKLRYQPSPTSNSMSEVWIMMSSYNNYMLFSTITFKDKIVSFGFLGRVQTTDDIRTLY
jgi:hypothetical protein